MNSINYFNNKKKFPLSTQVLDFAQNIIKQAHKLAIIGGGDKYILSNCIDSAGVWSQGYVVVKGEILPFVGGAGTLASQVRIKETKADIVAEYDTYNDVMTSRILEFGSNVGGNDTFLWSDFVRLKSNVEIAAQYATKVELASLSNLLMPKGGIIMWSGAITSIPNGFTLCNGATIQGYGVVPDLRGRFVVGYDSASNNLPANVIDEKRLNYGAIGNKGGKPDVQLTAAQSGLPAHKHTFLIEKNDPGYNHSAISADIDKGNVLHNYDTSTVAAQAAAQSHENRPPYYVLAFIIKVV